MDVRELEDGLRGRLGNKVDYLGVFTSDTLPHIHSTNKPIVFIANTLKSSTDVRTVGHWISFYVEFSPIQRVVFFDSYGLHPSIYCDGFTEFINKYHKFSIYDYGLQLQPDTSIKCGLYVSFFIHFLSFNGINKFSWRYKHVFSKRDLQSNDRYVTLYYLKHLSKSCRKWKYGTKKAITYQECKQLNQDIIASVNHE